MNPLDYLNKLSDMLHNRVNPSPRIPLAKEDAGYRGKLENAYLTIKTIDGKKCLYDRSGNIVSLPDFDDIVQAGWGGRGWKVKTGEKWGMINERLEVMIPAEYEEIELVDKYGFMIKKGGKWGFLPIDGPILQNFFYEEVDKYIVSGWKGFRAKINGKWGLAGFDGNVIVPFVYDELSLGVNGMVKVKSGGRFGFINVNKGITFRIEYDYAEDFTSSNADMTVVGQNGLEGVIDTDGSVIIPLKYDTVYIDGKNRFRVKKNEHYGIVDKDLNTIFPFVYRNLGCFDKDGVTYAMNEHGKYGYVDKNNNEIIGFQFESAYNFNDEGYALISKGYHQEGLIDKSGATVIPARYVKIFLNWDGVAELIAEDDRREYVRGIYDLRTGGSVPCLYDRIRPLGRNHDGIMEFECWIPYGNEPERRFASKKGRSVRLADRTIFSIKYSVADSRVNIEDIKAGREDSAGLSCQCIADNGILNLPKEIDGMSVVAIADFCQCRELNVKGLIVPEGYRYIGIDVFKANPYLEFVSLPNGIREIRDCAFSCCRNLKHVFMGRPIRGIFLHTLSNPFSSLAVSKCAFAENNPAVTYYVPDEIRFPDPDIDESRFYNIKRREDYEDRIIGEYRNTTTCIEVQGGTLAVARDFAISLEPDGCGIRLHGNNPDFRELCRERRHNFVKLTAGFDGYMALDDRGHIHPGPIEREFQTGYELSRLENVVDVVSCEGHTVALHSDGTVTCVDEPSSYEGPERFAGRVETWTDIKQVACGFDFVLGLKSDGTLISVSAGNYYRTPDWHGVRQVDAFNCYYGNIYTIAVLEDGSVVADFCDDVAAWADVKKVVVGDHGCAIGLKNDGSLYAVGNEIFVRKVSSWRNVIDVECKFDNAIALLADGSVVSTF